jgi:AraC-like DNA-binding protein
MRFRESAHVDSGRSRPRVRRERAFRGNGAGVVVDALRCIERNCLGRLTLNDVAAAVGRTPTYVTTALTQATGRSAGQWIVSGRMAEARRLLLHSNERVDVVAERVGYADATPWIRTLLPGTFVEMTLDRIRIERTFSPARRSA